MSNAPLHAKPRQNQDETLSYWDPALATGKGVYARGSTTDADSGFSSESQGHLEADEQHLELSQQLPGAKLYSKAVFAVNRSIESAGSVVGIGVAGIDEEESTDAEPIKAPTGLFSTGFDFLEEWVNDQVFLSYGEFWPQEHAKGTEQRPEQATEHTAKSSFWKSATISEDQTNAVDLERQRFFVLLDPSLISQSEETIQRGHPGLKPPPGLPAHLLPRLFKGARPRSPPRPINLSIRGANQSFDMLNQHHDMEAEARNLNTKEKSRMDRISELEYELATLRGDLGGVEKAPTFQVLHVLDRDTTKYLAEPSWQVEGHHTYLKGNMPLSKPDDFLSGLGNVAFVVYMEYSPRPALDESLDAVARTKTKAIPNPKPFSHTIKLLSPSMKDAANAFFDKITKLNPEFPHQEQDHTFESPFLFWYHYRSTGILKELDPSQRALMELLTNWIGETYGGKYSEVDALLDRGVVTQDAMKFLWHPGQTLVLNEYSPPVGCIATTWVTENTVSENGSDFEEPPKFQASAWFYDYDGRFWKHGIDITLKVRKFEQQPETRIDKLFLYPLRFASAELEAQLENRGHIFWRCRRRHFVSYTTRNEDDILKSSDERYMVDFSTYRMLHSDSVGFQQKYGSNRDRRYMPEELMNEEQPPAGYETVFPKSVTGFNMRRKKWQDLEVDRIQNVKWYKEAFDHLVIGEETKELVQALITNRIESEKNTDWVTNKGNGLIMLLHGGPGTGKTFTAESVAELAEKPLYSITCGDIGTKPEDVEKYLESAFHLGKLWDCVVLLDEADVFLEQRTLNDLKRNALVSVFLRVLEYYEGILMLTTNRVGIFDEAFKSRIQLALHYDNLDKSQRVQIWKNFFSRLQMLEGEEGVIDFDTLESYFDELAEYPMNGRQIRNTITTARQLAKFKKRPMGYGHLRHVIKVAGKFDQYLLEVHDKISDDQIARGEGVR
ncbi:hypothetical protein PG991_016142 [Apiospora marii]|uniref:AAA+ ATPase domain-containing protein n=1 Tax=Apiospora marii TaxID=335849 RepID=A0ABR1R0Q1_9PEZI